MSGNLWQDEIQSYGCTVADEGTVAKKGTVYSKPVRREVGSWEVEHNGILGQGRSAYNRQWGVFRL